MNTLIRDIHANKLNFIHPPYTFFHFEEQIIVFQDSENLFNHLIVFFKCFGEDEKVIHVDNKDRVVNLIAEWMVHHGLEDSKTH